jgi:hypothetical protein
MNRISTQFLTAAAIANDPAAADLAMEIALACIDELTKRINDDPDREYSLVTASILADFELIQIGSSDEDVLRNGREISSIAVRLYLVALANGLIVSDRPAMLPDFQLPESNTTARGRLGHSRAAQ